MNRLFTLLALLASCAAAVAADVGVSITVGDPGYYGRIDIGNALRPVLVYPRPVLITPPPRRVALQPLYLRVPPGHAKHWSKHCARYGACGRPVYFVQDNWYRQVYAPEYARRHHGGRYGERRHDERRGHGRQHGNAEARGSDRD